MSIVTRITEAAGTFEEDRQRVDDALDGHPIGYAAAISFWIAANFIGSCLAAATPPVETIIAGVAVCGATFLGFLIVYRFAGERLFPESFGPKPTSEPAEQKALAGWLGRRREKRRGKQERKARRALDARDGNAAEAS